jgi:hypothetical protein
MRANQTDRRTESYDESNSPLSLFMRKRLLKLMVPGVGRFKQELNMPKFGSEMLKKENIYKTCALLKE